MAARAINNIIGGATSTGADGSSVVQPGLQSDPANCVRYTGSRALTSRSGFPSLCARPVASPAGQAALVADVYQKWVVGAAPQAAQDAAVLFENRKTLAIRRSRRFSSACPTRAVSVTYRHQYRVICPDIAAQRSQERGELMPSASKPWWQQVTALVSLGAGGAVTGFSFVPRPAADLTSPASMPVHLMALEQSAQPARRG